MSRTALSPPRKKETKRKSLKKIRRRAEEAELVLAQRKYLEKSPEVKFASNGSRWMTLREKRMRWAEEVEQNLLGKATDKALKATADPVWTAVFQDSTPWGAEDEAAWSPFFEAVRDFGLWFACQQVPLFKLERLIDAARKGNSKARTIWLKAANALVEIGSGRTESITKEERSVIVEACNKWRPICEGLNKDFKKLWKLHEYVTSKLHKKEAQGTLAKKFKIDVEDVKAIETYLQAPSHNAKKTTPFSAMLRIVARKHFPQGTTSRHVKTVEKIYREWLKTHPEAKRRKEKPATTSFADERTA